MVHISKPMASSSCYIGMCVVMGMYSYVFCKDVIHSLMNIETFTEETMLMLAIGIVDVSMV